MERLRVRLNGISYFGPGASMQASPLPTPGEIEAVVPVPEDQIPADPVPDDELDADAHDPDWFDDEAFGGSSSGFAEAPQGW
ncbi:hypothetical protein [Synechococcus sp. UW140]|uniref:hypothetical protein n=1 Tax=Synechococcus sp. UW140 TaxID=368503 RepID=UPI0025FA0D9E|nr:hypothetical protein [Synechococcus sp. UW140]MCX5928907.1 hypothetical protein [Synechococcus sp. LacPavin_0920_WC12_MAG_50_7]